MSPPTTRPTYVYFLQVGDHGPIKIGVSTDPRKRFKAAQTGNHNRLRMIGTVRGDDTLEVSMHECLAGDRVSGEWFNPTKPVLDLIAAALLTGAPEYRDQWRSSLSAIDQALKVVRRDGLTPESANRLVSNMWARRMPSMAPGHLASLAAADEKPVPPPPRERVPPPCKRAPTRADVRQWLADRRSAGGEP